MPPSPRYDVVILGGGPAGLAAAISLRMRAELSVLVVEAGDPDRERIGESCPPDLVLLLEQLRLRERFRRDGHAPCPGYASVWGRAQVGYNDFIVNPLGPAWCLDRKAFDRMLAEAALERGAPVRWSTRFTDVRRGDDGDWHLQLAGPGAEPRVRAGFVVDASGAKARFAHRVGERKQIDDRLVALIRFARIRSGHLTRQVLLEAVPEGWWYGALLPDERVVTMMVTERTTLRRLRSEPDAYARALGSTTLVGPRLEPLELDEPVEYLWPILSGRLTEVRGPGWLAIGDAACSFDPLAAQGIHKALADGIEAGRLLTAAGEPRADPATTLAERYRLYRQQRAYFYALERRWPDAPFWRNRSETSPVWR